MTVIILYVLLWLWDNRTFDSITKTNQRKIEAERNYRDKQYAESARLYEQITYGSVFSDPAARLNLAHSYFRLGKYNEALKHYLLLEKVENTTLASIASSQAGLIRIIQKDTADALKELRKAIILEPGNNLARNNYIILKKHFSGQEQPSDVNTSRRKSEEQQIAANNAETQQPNPANKEIVEGEKKEDLLKNLKAMNMSEEQARAILDAMKSNESQYIYQLRRKQYGRRKRTEEEEVAW